MEYQKGKHSVFYHRYHVVWITKYRFKVLTGEVRLRVSDFIRKAKGRSSHKVQMEFPQLRKRYWGRHFWARGYFCATAGAITDETVLQYLERHVDKPTDASQLVVW